MTVEETESGTVVAARVNVLVFARASCVQVQDETTCVACKSCLVRDPLRSHASRWNSRSDSHTKCNEAAVFFLGQKY
mgnify:CR=1 FL=1